MVIVTMKTNVRKKLTIITFTAETAKDFCEVLNATDFYGTGEDPIFDYLKNRAPDYSMTTSTGKKTEAVLEIIITGLTDFLLKEIEYIIGKSDEDYAHFVYIYD
jgi:hypothetical protein